VVDRARAELAEERLGAERFQIRDAEWPQMQNIVAREFLARVDHVNLRAEKRHFNRRTEPARPGADYETLFAFRDAFLELNRVRSRREVNSVLGARAYLVQQLLRFPGCYLLPQFVQKRDAVKTVDVDVYIVEQLVKSLERCREAF